MNYHEGVSCDSCLKGNFRGRRYKCLICYDYDLCGPCYDSGSYTSRHTTDHPMQCILTRTDFDLYYAGEVLSSVDQPQAYTCPYCNKMGYTDNTLQEHVTNEHSDLSYEVVCPVCASSSGGDPNLMTDDFAGHLTLEHRSGPRDLISFLDEPVSTRHNVRRIPHSAGRGVSGPRSRRSNMHFSSSGGLTSLSPSSRENVDPIAELLSQLSGVRRSATTTNTSVSASTPSQLQQLQMQLQLERQQVNIARQQLERLPRRQLQTSVGGIQTTSTIRESAGITQTVPISASSTNNGILLNSLKTAQASSQDSQYLLTGLMEELNVETTLEEQRAERSIFVQQLMLSTISQQPVCALDIENMLEHLVLKDDAEKIECTKDNNII